MRPRVTASCSVLLALCTVSVASGNAQAPLLPGVIGSPAPAPASPARTELPESTVDAMPHALPTSSALPAPSAPLAEESESSVALGKSGALRVTFLTALNTPEVAESFSGPSGTE